MFTIIFAFILGFALSRASTCTVAATERLVMRRRIDWLLGILVASSWAAITLFVLAGFSNMPLNLPTASGVTLTLLIGVGVMGLGAWLNGGCFIGSVGRISSGKLSFVFTFLGLAVARTLSVHQGLPALEPLPRGARLTLEDGWLYWILLGMFLALGVWSCIRLYRRRQQAIFALVVMGVAATLLFVTKADWSYEALIGRFVSGAGTTPDLLFELSVLALFVGAVLSSVLNQKFKVQLGGIRLILMNFCGGLLMGIGAIFVQSGNDTLLLWVMPSMALHGFVAYFGMVGVVAALIAGQSVLYRALGWALKETEH